MKFKLLRGQHCEGLRGADGKMIRYKPNDIFESAIDLEKKFNSPGSRKFERVSDDTPVTRNAVAEAAKAGFNTIHTDSNGTDPLKDATFNLSDLDKMDVPALIQLAADEEINVGNTKDKKKLIEVIKQAMTATANA